MSFEHIKVGDTPTRMLAGKIALQLVVGKVDEEFIYCGSGPSDSLKVKWEDGWKFRRTNGAEVDEDLGWDGIKSTGSFLINDQGDTVENMPYVKSVEEVMLEKDNFVHNIKGS